VSLQTHKFSMSLPKERAQSFTNENASQNQQQATRTEEFLPNTIYRGGSSSRMHAAVSGSFGEPNNYFSPRQAMAFAPMDAASEQPPVLHLSEHFSLIQSGRELGYHTRSAHMSTFPASAGSSQTESETESESVATEPGHDHSTDEHIRPTVVSGLSNVMSTLASSEEVKHTSSNAANMTADDRQPSIPPSNGVPASSSDLSSPPGVDISLAMNQEQIRHLHTALNKAATSTCPAPTTAPASFQECAESDSVSEADSDAQVDLVPSEPEGIHMIRPTSPAPALAPSIGPTSSVGVPPEAPQDAASLNNLSSVATVSDTKAAKPDQSPLQPTSTQCVVCHSPSTHPYVHATLCNGTLFLIRMHSSHSYTVASFLQRSSLIIPCSESSSAIREHVCRVWKSLPHCWHHSCRTR
jgi:hypothetical protein